MKLKQSFSANERSAEDNWSDGLFHHRFSANEWSTYSCRSADSVGIQMRSQKKDSLTDDGDGSGFSANEKSTDG
jgi:hypothetical protein